MAENSQSPLSNRHKNAEPTDVDSDPLTSRHGLHHEQRRDASEHATELYDSDHGYTPKSGGFTGPSDDLKGLSPDNLSGGPYSRRWERGSAKPRAEAGEPRPMPVHDVSRAR